MLASNQDEEAVLHALAERYRTWLEEVALLITDAERASFLALSEDYQRDAFVDAFWDERDPDPRTGRNELRDAWRERVHLARTHFETLDDGRSRFMMANGWPHHRYDVECRGITWPLEVWFYEGTERTSKVVPVIFFRHWGGPHWRLWTQGDGNDALFEHSSLGGSQVNCNYEKLLAAFELLRRINQEGGRFAYIKLIGKLEEPPASPAGEWVLTFDSYRTDLPTDRATFATTLRAAFPGWHGDRTIVQGMIEIDVADLVPADLRGHRTYNLILNGEVLRGDELLERFRYRFDLPERELPTEGPLPLVFERHLRPGDDYRFVIRVEDRNGERFSRIVHPFAVPYIDRERPAPVTDATVAEAFADANRRLADGEASIEILMPFGTLMTGLLRFDTLVVGDRIDKVTFAVDGREILTKRTPPYSVELDMGDLPRSQLLRVTAFDADGRAIASDEQLLNGSPHRFAVRFVDPQDGDRHGRSVRARVDVQVPEQASLASLTLYRDDTPIATLHQPPFTLPVTLPSAQMTLLRAVGELRDGTTAEDVVVVNGPPLGEEIDVDLVELYTTVLDRDRRPVRGLDTSDFQVFEDGHPQQLTRFEAVSDVAISASVLIDVSASMAPRIDTARDAAVDFADRLLTSDTHGRDRIAAITFNDRPRVVAPFTKELGAFAEGIAGLDAERGTALHDSLIYALYYANGLPGHRTLLVLSDGVDEHSRFTFEEALDYARRSQVAIYTIGVDLPSRSRSPARRVLGRLAEETGGRAYFLEDIDGLGTVYAGILDELRAKYLLAYQSRRPDGDDVEGFRRVEVEVEGRGLRAQTMLGYYP